jgi:hypothetical protein
MTADYSFLMSRTPEHYRQEAERCRKMAGELDRDTKANLLDVARQYDELADEAAKKQ